MVYQHKHKLRRSLVYSTSFVVGILALSGFLITLPKERKSEEIKEQYAFEYTAETEDSEQIFTEVNAFEEFNDVVVSPVEIESIEVEQKPVEPEISIRKWREKLVDNIRSETTEETIRNIGNFDGLHLAHTGTPVKGAEFDTLSVTRYARVRRILAKGRENPQLVVTQLWQQLHDSLEGWEDACRGREENYRNGVRTYSEPDAYIRAKSHCLTATYLLAELGYCDALPLLAKQYRGDFYPDNKQPPVMPAMTLYAMHRLVSSYPEYSLSRGAKLILDEYLKAADCLPPPRKVKVTAWDATYSESDPLIVATGQAGRGLAREKTMDLYVYPTEFTDGTNMHRSIWGKSERMNELFNKIEEFIDIVYPPNDEMK